MHKETEVGEIPIGMAAAEGVALTALTNVKNGKIDEAVACFAEEFTFKDQGIGLEFKSDMLLDKLDKFYELLSNTQLPCKSI